jgi:hypothetical protein
MRTARTHTRLPGRRSRPRIPLLTPPGTLHHKLATLAGIGTSTSTSSPSNLRILRLTRQVLPTLQQGATLRMVGRSMAMERTLMAQLASIRPRGSSPLLMPTARRHIRLMRHTIPMLARHHRTMQRHHRPLRLTLALLWRLQLLQHPRPPNASHRYRHGCARRCRSGHKRKQKPSRSLQLRRQLLRRKPRQRLQKMVQRPALQAGQSAFLASCHLPVSFCLHSVVASVCAACRVCAYKPIVALRPQCI